ncbi:MAG: hypothetical protein H7X97_07740 [Opitutaceae bacterium]|nr:hypothetical protein [Verrucomicrobiales bacterium]
MKRNFTDGFRAGMAAAAGVLLLAGSAWAYPPAPHHVIFGMVRDELGDPLNITSAEVRLVTPDGRQIVTTVSPGLEAGVNYRLIVPMDAGITSDNYKPTALRPALPFTLKIKLGNVIYLPIELKGNYSALGVAGGLTRVDLTLGEDLDNDGLPDAWERLLIARAGGSLTLADIRPGDDFDQDGMSNLNEYLAGTYAFDPQDGFELAIVGFNAGAPLMEYVAISGRTYTIVKSTNLTTWTSVQFRVSAEGVGAPLRDSYLAADVRKVRVEVPVPGGAQGGIFFRALVK